MALLRILKLAVVLAPFVPSWIGYRICALLGVLYFVASAGTRRNVHSNLSCVAPRQSWFDRTILAARVCVTVATNYYDLVRSHAAPPESARARIDIKGLEYLEQALAHGRGAIIVSGHLGNFSVMAQLPATLGYRAAAVAEQIEPRSLFEFKCQLRSGSGVEIIPAGYGSVRRIVELLNDNGILLVAGDRDVTDRGMPVQFFGNWTTLPTGPVILAMRTGAALIPAYTLRAGTERSHVQIEPAIELVSTRNWKHDLCANLTLMSRRLEEIILEDPGQWAVLQPVWPQRVEATRIDRISDVDHLPTQEIATQSPDETPRGVR